MRKMKWLVGTMALSAAITGYADVNPNSLKVKTIMLDVCILATNAAVRNQIVNITSNPFGRGGSNCLVPPLPTWSIRVGTESGMFCSGNYQAVTIHDNGVCGPGASPGGDPVISVSFSTPSIPGVIDPGIMWIEGVNTQARIVKNNSYFGSSQPGMQICRPGGGCFSDIIGNVQDGEQLYLYNTQSSFARN